MKKTIIFTSVVIIIIGAIGYVFIADRQQKASENKNIIDGQIKKTMNISSPAFSQNGMIPKKYTCDGENINPAIIIENVPDNAKSLALIVDDPDAPAGIWNHWLVWNIDPKIKMIAGNNIPSGAIVGANTSGKIGYSGPCPPSGSHRYIFKLYALDITLDAKSGSKKNMVEGLMKGHILDYGELVGLYLR